MLKPIPKVSEKFELESSGKLVDSDKFNNNPIQANKVVSIETALIFGEPERFYQIVSEDDSKEPKIIGMTVINLPFDNEDCSLILFRNWTHNFQRMYQEQQLEMNRLTNNIISQKFITPLNHIYMRSQCIRLPDTNESLGSSLDSQSHTQERLEQLQSRVYMYQHQFMNMIDLYNIRQGRFVLKYEHFNLKKSMNITLNHFKEAAELKNIQLKLEVNKHAAKKVCTDELRLSQIVGCLVQNSIENTQDGQIVVGCWSMPDDNVLEVTVEDNGCGINNNVQLKLFNIISLQDHEMNLDLAPQGLYVCS